MSKNRYASEMTAPSESIEEYLEGIYKLQQEEKPATNSLLAQRLGLSPASVSEMMRRLAERGLVVYRPYEGVSLTTEGRKQALGLIRRHRLWERLLTDVLGLDWDVVHDEACRLEHATSDFVTERLAQVLEDSKTCPHGHPIPTSKGQVAKLAVVPLSELETGESGLIEYITEEKADLLRYLENLGLVPKALVTVEARAPFEGPVTVSTQGRRHALGRRAASAVMVKPR